jgi:hypothetical protein
MRGIPPGGVGTPLGRIMSGHEVWSRFSGLRGMRKRREHPAGAGPRRPSQAARPG